MNDIFYLGKEEIGIESAVDFFIRKNAVIQGPYLDSFNIVMNSEKYCIWTKMGIEEFGEPEDIELLSNEKIKTTYMITNH